MDQSGGPQQVVDIVEAPSNSNSNSKEEGDRVDSCYSKTATKLGVLHIFCGVITFICGMLIGLLDGNGLVDSNRNKIIWDKCSTGHQTIILGL